MDSKRFVALQEIAVEFNISKATVNYYTNLGLLNVAKKQGNKRLYDKEEVARRINIIRDLLSKGYTLKVIQRDFLNT
jgi:DNA-binding transcriptional MerR regulator